MMNVYSVLAELATKLAQTSDELLVGISPHEKGIIIEGLDNNISADAMEVIIAVCEKHNLRMSIDATEGLAIRLW